MRDSYSSGPARGAGYGTLLAWARFVPQLPEVEAEPPPVEPPPTEPPPTEPPPTEPPPEEVGLRRRASRGVGRGLTGPSLLSVPKEPVLQHGFGISVKLGEAGKLIATIDPALRSRYWTAQLTVFGAALLGSTVPVEIESIDETAGTLVISAPDVADVVVSLTIIGCGS
jgi:hypothetical protein